LLDSLLQEEKVIYLINKNESGRGRKVDKSDEI